MTDDNNAESLMLQSQSMEDHQTFDRENYILEHGFEQDNIDILRAPVELETDVNSIEKIENLKSIGEANMNEAGYYRAYNIFNQALSLPGITPELYTEIKDLKKRALWGKNPETKNDGELCEEGYHAYGGECYPICDDVNDEGDVVPGSNTRGYYSAIGVMHGLRSEIDENNEHQIYSYGKPHFLNPKTDDACGAPVNSSGSKQGFRLIDEHCRFACDGSAFCCEPFWYARKYLSTGGTLKSAHSKGRRGEDGQFHTDQTPYTEATRDGAGESLATGVFSSAGIASSSGSSEDVPIHGLEEQPIKLHRGTYYDIDSNVNRAVNTPEKRDFNIWQPRGSVEAGLGDFPIDDTRPAFEDDGVHLCYDGCYHHKINELGECEESNLQAPNQMRPLKRTRKFSHNPDFPDTRASWATQSFNGEASKSCVHAAFDHDMSFCYNKFVKTSDSPTGYSTCEGVDINHRKMCRTGPPKNPTGEKTTRPCIPRSAILDNEKKAPYCLSNVWITGKPPTYTEGKYDWKDENNDDSCVCPPNTHFDMSMLHDGSFTSIYNEDRMMMKQHYADYEDLGDSYGLSFPMTVPDTYSSIGETGRSTASMENIKARADKLFVNDKGARPMELGPGPYDTNFALKHSFICKGNGTGPNESLNENNEKIWKHPDNFIYEPIYGGGSMTYHESDNTDPRVNSKGKRELHWDNYHPEDRLFLPQHYWKYKNDNGAVIGEADFPTWRTDIGGEVGSKMVNINNGAKSMYMPEAVSGPKDPGWNIVLQQADDGSGYFEADNPSGDGRIIRFHDGRDFEHDTSGNFMDGSYAKNNGNIVDVAINDPNPSKYTYSPRVINKPTTSVIDENNNVKEISERDRAYVQFTGYWPVTAPPSSYNPITNRPRENWQQPIPVSASEWYMPIGGVVWDHRAPDSREDLRAEEWTPYVNPRHYDD